MLFDETVDLTPAQRRDLSSPGGVPVDKIAVVDGDGNDGDDEDGSFAQRKRVRREDGDDEVVVDEGLGSVDDAARIEEVITNPSAEMEIEADDPIWLAGTTPCPMIVHHL